MYDETYEDVMHLSLCYQLADGMLRQSLYSLGTLLNGEHFHRLNFMLLLGIASHRKWCILSALRANFQGMLNFSRCNQK